MCSLPHYHPAKPGKPCWDHKDQPSPANGSSACCEHVPGMGNKRHEAFAALLSCCQSCSLPQIHYNNEAKPSETLMSPRGSTIPFQPFFYPEFCFSVASQPGGEADKAEPRAVPKLFSSLCREREGGAAEVGRITISPTKDGQLVPRTMESSSSNRTISRGWKWSLFQHKQGFPGRAGCRG